MNVNRTYAQEMLGGLSPAGRQVQQVLTPDQQYRVSGTIRPPAQRGYEDPVAMFESLDPADDGFLEKQAYILDGVDPNLIRNPRVAASLRQKAAMHAEAQQYFKADPSNARFYAEQRAQGIAPDVALGSLRNRVEETSVRDAFQKQGGLLEEFESLRDANGKVDRAVAMDFLTRAERASKQKAASAPKELTAGAYARLLQTEDDLAAAQRSVDLSPENKTLVFEKEFKRKPSTPEEWDRAHELANRDVRAAQDKLRRLKTAYSSQYQMPAEFSVDGVESGNVSSPGFEELSALPIEEAEVGAATVPALQSASVQAAPAPQEGSLGSLSADEEAASKVASEAAISEPIAQINDVIQAEREKAVQNLAPTFSKLGDDKMLRRAARSILSGESIPLNVLGLEDKRDFAGGIAFVPAVDAVAQKLGLDPNQAVEGTGPSGKKFQLFDTTLKNKGEPVRVRDLIVDYANKLIGSGSPQNSQIKSSIPGVTIGEIRKVK